MTNTVEEEIKKLRADALQDRKYASEVRSEAVVDMLKAVCEQKKVWFSVEDIKGKERSLVFEAVIKSSQVDIEKVMQSLTAVTERYNTPRIIKYLHKPELTEINFKVLL